MILSLLLSLAVPAATETSTFVETAHRHDWALLDDRIGGAMWWDRNFIDERVFANVAYPVILTRLALSGDEKPFDQADMLVAVDCDRSRVAWFEFQATKEAVAGARKREREILKFDPLPGPDREETQTMMRTVCGEGWTL